MQSEPQPRPYDAVLGGAGKQQQPPSFLEPTDFDAKRLSQLVLAKRGKHGYKDTAKEIGIRFIAIYQAEISHIKNSSFPTRIHFEDFLALCKWLDVPPAQLVTTPTLQKIIVARGGRLPGPYDAVQGGRISPTNFSSPYNQ